MTLDICLFAGTLGFLSQAFDKVFRTLVFDKFSGFELNSFYSKRFQSILSGHGAISQRVQMSQR